MANTEKELLSRKETMPMRMWMTLAQRNHREIVSYPAA
jgi:hypothetical protein